MLGELEHIKIETRLIDEKFVSVMGECDPSKLSVILKTADLATLLLFIIRVKRELKRVYINGCRYN